MGNAGLCSCVNLNHSSRFSRPKLTERERASTINRKKRPNFKEPLLDIREQENEEYSCKSFETGDDFNNTADQSAMGARTAVTRLSIGE